MLKTVSVMAALALAAFPVLARAGTGDGQIPCDQDVQQVGRQLESQAGRMSPARLHDARERLRVAKAQCGQSLDYAEVQLQQLRQELGAGVGPQTAERPAGPRPSP
jgi:hypothetical protein